MGRYRKPEKNTQQTTCFPRFVAVLNWYQQVVGVYRIMFKHTRQVTSFIHSFHGVACCWNYPNRCCWGWFNWMMALVRKKVQSERIFSDNNTPLVVHWRRSATTWVSIAELFASLSRGCLFTPQSLLDGNEPKRLTSVSHCVVYFTRTEEKEWDSRRRKEIRWTGKLIELLERDLKKKVRKY